jgi:hypothetical protein
VVDPDVCGGNLKCVVGPKVCGGCSLMSPLLYDFGVNAFCANSTVQLHVVFALIS